MMDPNGRSTSTEDVRKVPNMDPAGESTALGLGSRSAPPGPSKTKEEVQSSPHRRDLSTPKLREREPALDFTLPTLDATHGLTEEKVRLSDYRSKSPVALIFGSYT